MAHLLGRKLVQITGEVWVCICYIGGVLLFENFNKSWPTCCKHLELISLGQSSVLQDRDRRLSVQSPVLI